MDIEYQIRSKYNGKLKASFDNEEKAICFLKQRKTNRYEVYITNSLSGSVRCITSGNELAMSSDKTIKPNRERTLQLNFKDD